MCGIIGYIGKNQAIPILIDGLKRLEYRGYDSAGFVVYDKGILFNEKAVGKIKNLEEKIDFNVITGNIGIAHTRWATHGEPSVRNAHPHSDCRGNVWVVHNGIIENYQELKKELEESGHIFISQTDTEVIAHLIEENYKGNLLGAIREVIKKIKGAYGLVIMHKKEPNKLIAVRYGSPLVIGIGDDEIIIASDPSAILRHTKQVIFLEDGEIAEVNKNNFQIIDFDFNEIKRDAQLLEWELDKIEKQGFKHFMLKEIFEQPQAIKNSIRGRIIEKEGKVKLGGVEEFKDNLKKIERLIITGCGTAYHAGLIGKYMIEEYAEIPVDVEYASELRYRKSLLDEKCAVLAISQSGETADTIAALKEAKEKGVLCLGIVNVVGSTIARVADAGAYNHIGPEIAVASTKAFTSQLAILALLTVFLGRPRKMSFATGQRILKELKIIPKKLEFILEQNDYIKNIAKKYCQAKNLGYLGRKYNRPIAIEGALKLKEISYIHAEGFPSGEMKHGSIALIDENFPCVVICPQDSVYEKNKNNIEELKARKGPVIAIATQGDEEIKKIADDIIYIPKTLEMLTPILTNLPLQLLAYHIADLKDLDVDKPRNLAKSVTVE